MQRLEATFSPLARLNAEDFCNFGLDRNVRPKETSEAARLPRSERSGILRPTGFALAVGEVPRGSPPDRNMTTASTPQWPDDPDGLAALAVDPNLKEEIRQEAFTRLLPSITRVVRRLALRFSGQTRQDLIDYAVADVLQALPQYQPGGSFEAWCRTMLRNRTIDRLRQSSRVSSLNLEEAAEEFEDDTCRQALEAALERTEMLRGEDVARMAAWPVRDRVVLGCLAGLWAKLPADRWAAWVEEFRSEHGWPAPGAFPPDDLANREDVAERTAFLAELLGVRLGTLRVWVHRGRQRLWQLSYVRDRVPQPGEGGA
jgi:RNA polymerase sigma factor (sigma-70 family)